MTTRVVHLRVKETTIVSCFDIIERFTNQSAVGMSGATAIRRSIEAFVQFLQSQDRIPTYMTTAALENRLAELHQQGTEIDISLEDSVASLMKAFNETKEEESTDDVVRRLAAQAEDMIRNDGIAIPVGEAIMVDASEVERAPIEYLDLTRQPRYTEQEVRLLATPSDPLVYKMRANLPEKPRSPEEEAYVLALCNVYKFMDHTLWGTAVAAKAILKLMREAGFNVIRS